ncbi:MAG TPA: sulfotransferase [Caulobacteraceae bacterium]|jgi:hypothetical protein
MALKVVGSGLGRTGSFSLKLALEQLGFGPCHHMVEVFAHPETTPLWVAASHGRPDWETVFKDYVSAVDYPTAGFWREIADSYPDAKVIHTERDPDAWFDSTQATIFAPGSFADNPPPQLKEFFESFTGPLAGHIHDRAFMTDFFRRHSDEVKATIAPERLLVLQVGEGWERLCAFLGVPVPGTPYPQENTREQFIGRVAAARTADAS